MSDPVILVVVSALVPAAGAVGGQALAARLTVLQRWQTHAAGTVLLWLWTILRLLPTVLGQNTSFTAGLGFVAGAWLVLAPSLLCGRATPETPAPVPTVDLVLSGLLLGLTYAVTHRPSGELAVVLGAFTALRGACTAAWAGASPSRGFAGACLSALGLSALGLGIACWGSWMLADRATAALAGGTAALLLRCILSLAAVDQVLARNELRSRSSAPASAAPESDVESPAGARRPVRRTARN